MFKVLGFSFILSGVISLSSAHATITDPPNSLEQAIVTGQGKHFSGKNLKPKIESCETTYFRSQVAFFQAQVFRSLSQPEREAHYMMQFGELNQKMKTCPRTLEVDIDHASHQPNS